MERMEGHRLSSRKKREKAALRRIPSVDQVLSHPALAGAGRMFRHEIVLAVVRQTLGEERMGALEEEDVSACPSDMTGYLAGRAARRLEALFDGSLRRVVNGTGIVLHTNLGRSPLGAELMAEAADRLAGYVPVEYDRKSGGRTQRGRSLTPLVQLLTGAEDSLVVNNNAAAVLLALSALAAGREVIVSRGEMVEIGGGFRIPEVIASGGAILREVGTTNRTRPSDYADAFGEQTGAVLKVHHSNFVMRGFVEETDPKELAELCARHALPLIYDLGSGLFLPEEMLGGSDAYGPGDGEMTVERAVKLGADVVCFSADKLLGGPQAGVLVGKKKDIDRMRRHPLYRALRPDKTALVLLERCLCRYMRRDQAAQSLPVFSMLCQPLWQVESRAKQLSCSIRGAVPKTVCDVGVRRSRAQAGGGTLPGKYWESCSVTLRPRILSVEQLTQNLRLLPLPVVARVEDGQVWIDLMTVEMELDERLAKELSNPALYQHRTASGISKEIVKQEEREEDR